ncbi:MAG TPA: TonB-dependent receptor, partial [Nevskiaceae bacterium]|nr:TonB-dependent receptor [Nevskiaceae bacterium]
APVVATVAVDGEATPAAAPAEEAATGSSNRLLGEIVVTAQKREENLQDVPIAVAAFSAEQLDAKGIDDPKALAISTPGLVYNFLAAYSIIYLRGVGSDVFIPSADASVATYIDGVYYPFNHGLAQSFGALERVEVLKGPQGTLFGRNSTGGAISVTTRKPDFKGVSSELQYSHASHEQNYTRAHVNIPLAERLAFSVSGMYNIEEPYYDLVPTFSHPEFPDDVTKGFRAKLRWMPIDDLDILLSETYIKPTGGSAQQLVGRDIKLAATALDINTREQPDYKDGSDLPVFFLNRTRVHVGDIKYTTPIGFDTRAIIAKQDIMSDANADYDGTNGNIASFRARNQVARVKTQELQLISNDDSWGADWLRWIGGIYHIDSEAGYDPLYFNVEANVIARLPGELPETVTDIFEQLQLPGIPGVNQGAGLVLRGMLGTKSTSYFAQATADITDWFSLTLGGRQQKEKREILKSSTSLQNPDLSEGLRLFNFPLRKAKTDNFSPKVSLEFRPWDNNMFYTSYTKGFKSGTFNIINIYQANSPFIPPETVQTYELGYKADLLDGYLRFNAAAFFNKLKNIQVQTISLTSGGAVRFESAGGAEIKGAEADLVWEFLPQAVPGLVATLSGMYLDGEYTDYENGSGYDEATGLFYGAGSLTGAPGRSYTGNETIRTPKFSGTFGLNYNFDLWKGNLEIAGDVYYNDGFFYTADNKDRVAEKSYHLINARISYLYTPWGLRVTAFGKNMNDGKYHNQMFENDFSTWKTLAPPSYYGVRLNWDFGA